MNGQTGEEGRKHLLGGTREIECLLEGERETLRCSKGLALTPACLGGNLQGRREDGPCWLGEFPLGVAGLEGVAKVLEESHEPADGSLLSLSASQFQRPKKFM